MIDRRSRDEHERGTRDRPYKVAHALTGCDSVIQRTDSHLRLISKILIHDQYSLINYEGIDEYKLTRVTFSLEPNPF